MSLPLIALDHVRLLLSLDEAELKVLLKILDKAPGMLTLPAEDLSALVGDVLGHLNRQINEAEQQLKSMRDRVRNEPSPPPANAHAVPAVQHDPCCSMPGGAHAFNCRTVPAHEPKVDRKDACIDCGHETPPGKWRCGHCQSKVEERRCQCKIQSDAVEYDYHLPKCRFRVETEARLKAEAKEQAPPLAPKNCTCELKDDEIAYQKHPLTCGLRKLLDPALQPPKPSRRDRAQEVARQNPPLAAQPPVPGLGLHSCKSSGCQRRFWAPRVLTGRQPASCWEHLAAPGQHNRIQGVLGLMIKAGM